MTTDNWEQCQITGKTFPQEELITFQGKRVSAEGKAILLERLKSGEAVSEEMQRPAVLRRFGCVFIDNLIFSIPSYLIGQNMTLQNLTAMTWMLVGLQALQVIYLGQMHGLFGKTLGKMAGTLRVVNLDGSPISLGKAYLRAIVYVLPSILAIAALFSRNNVLIENVNLFYGGWSLITIILALVDTKMQRPIHDRVTGTRVIQE